MAAPDIIYILLDWDSATDESPLPKCLGIFNSWYEAKAHPTVQGIDWFPPDRKGRHFAVGIPYQIYPLTLDEE